MMTLSSGWLGVGLVGWADGPVEEANLRVPD